MCCVCVCVCTCTYMCVCMWACVRTYMYVRMCECVCGIYTYVCDVHSKLDHQVKYLTSEFSFHPPLKKVFEFEGVSI